MQLRQDVFQSFQECMPPSRLLCLSWVLQLRSSGRSLSACLGCTLKRSTCFFGLFLMRCNCQPRRRMFPGFSYSGAQLLRFASNSNALLIETRCYVYAKPRSCFLVGWLTVEGRRCRSDEIRLFDLGHNTVETCGLVISTGQGTSLHAALTSLKALLIS